MTDTPDTPDFPGRPNVRALPNTEQDEIKARLEKLRRGMPAMLEFYALSAKAKKAHYDALLAAGFSAAQALELVKSDK